MFSSRYSTNVLHVLFYIVVFVFNKICMVSVLVFSQYFLTVLLFTVAKNRIQEIIMIIITPVISIPHVKRLFLFQCALLHGHSSQFNSRLAAEDQYFHAIPMFSRIHFVVPNNGEINWKSRNTQRLSK